MFDILLKNSELYGMQLNKRFRINNNILNVDLVYILLLVTSLIVIYSCVKEKKNSAPVINCSLPQSNICLNANDSVRVKVSVTDDSGPLTVSVYIVNGQMEAFTIPLVKTFSGTAINIDEFYFFNNLYFETGIYYIVINADDGENVVNKFIEINIVEIPKVLNSVYVGVRDISGVKIFANDTLGNYNQIGLVTSNIISACVNSYSKQISFLTNTGCLLTYSLPDFQLVWQKNGLSNPLHVFKGETKEYHKYTYVTDANGYFYGYDISGNERNLNSINNGAPFSFNFYNNKLIAFVEENGSNIFSIQSLFPNGGLVFKYQINFLPYMALNNSTNSVIVFGKSQNDVKMYTYYTEINNLQTFGNIIPGIFRDVIETPDNKYLLSVGNELKIIDKIYGNTFVYAFGKRADFMKFETLSQVLYTVDSNNITMLNYPSSSILDTYIFNDKILFFDYYYNK